MRIVGNGLSTCEDKTDSGATCAEENGWMSTAKDSSFSDHVFIPTISWEIKRAVLLLRNVYMYLWMLGKSASPVKTQYSVPVTTYYCKMHRCTDFKSLSGLLCWIIHDKGRTSSLYRDFCLHLRPLGCVSTPLMIGTCHGAHAVPCQYAVSASKIYLYLDEAAFRHVVFLARLENQTGWNTLGKFE